MINLHRSALSAPPIRSSSAIVQPSDVHQLLQQGVVLYEAEQYAEAISIWEQSVSESVIQVDKLAQALALSNLSLAHQQLGQWAEAEQSIASSLALLQTMESATDAPGVL